MYIKGKWTESKGGKFFASYNPATGDRIGLFPDGNGEDAAAAVEAAAEAFPSWSASTAYERSRYLYKAYTLFLERKEDIARIMTEEQGKHLRAALGEVQYAADFLIWFAEEVKRLYGRTIPAPREDQRFMVLNHPVGVVAAIIPWNYPVSMITRKAAPALAAGCTVVLKPAEQTPNCASAVFGVFHDAGFPPGVVNLVPAQDPREVAEVFLSSPQVKKITFTGSTEVGKMIASKAAAQMKRFSMELGGHAPFVVFPDADPVHAAKGLALVKFLNTGQACISPNRIYVHELHLEAFTEELVKRVGKLKTGNGMEEGVSLGPLMSLEALEKIDAQVEDAVKKGAKLLTGGTRLSGAGLENGFFYAPTVLVGVNSKMKIYREETFGPVAPIISFNDKDDILSMANDTMYGLASYVYTGSLSRAFRMAEGLQFGIIGINDINPTAVAVPFCGIKESGAGIEGSIEGIEEFLYKKSVGFSV